MTNTSDHGLDPIKAVVTCVQYPTRHPLHERHDRNATVVHHEILFRAHDAMGHKVITEIVARIPDNTRHT